MRTLDEYSQKEMTAFAVIDDARAFKLKADLAEIAKRRGGGQK